jgi:hypothetical protein
MDFRKCWTVVRISSGCLALFLLSVSAFAQGGSTGRIMGSITDSTGAVIGGAMVSITDTQRGQTRNLTTDEAGAYNAPELIPGTYVVKVEFPGFKSAERQNIVVEVGKEYRVDLSVEPGEQSDKITVTEGLPLVETTTGTLGGTIANALIAELPVQGRNFQKLLELRPGTYLAPGSGKWSLSSNGMRREHNVYILNGMDTIEGFSSQSVVNAAPVFGDATSIVPIDAIQEFNTQQVPKAEYGWKPGAVVNVGLRSGDNTLHGTAYAFGRSDAFDARNPFILAGSPKQSTEMEDFGGTVGGPIKRDRLFFLFGYEGQLNTIGAPSSSLTLPTRASLGNIGQSVLDACIALSAANAPKDLSLKMAGLIYRGPGNCAIDPQNRGVFQDRNTVTYSAAPIGTATLHNGLAKIDYRLNEQHTIAGEYFIGNYEGLGPQNNAAAQPYWSTFTHAKSMVMGLHWTWLPNSAIVNELRGGFNRENQLSYPGDCNNIGQPDYSYLAGMNSNGLPMAGSGLPANCGFPVITISPFSATGCCNNFPKIQGPDWTKQIIDNVSYIRGTHSFKFGGEGRRLIYNGGTYTGTRGSFTFNNLTDFLTGTQSTSSPPSLFLGQPSRHLTEWAFAGFFQDDWRITTRLTLNLGFRYETVTPIQEGHNQLGNFDPNSPTGLVQVGHGLNSLWNRTNNFSPRLGFAWDMKGDSKWVLRGAGSIIPVIEGFNVFVSQQGVSAIGVNAIPTGALLNGVQGPGDITTASIQYTSGINWSIAGPVFPSTGTIRCDSPLNPAPNNRPCAITAVAPNFRRPYAGSWTLSVQHAFTNDLSLQVAYVGTHGTALIGLNDINAPLPGSGWLTGPTPTSCNTPFTPAQIITGAASSSATCENLRRPYFSKFPYLSNINYISNQDFSNYHGMQVTLNQRPWHGVSYLLGYTWSHSLDEAGGDWNGSALPSNLFNVRSDYGAGNDDVRHRMTLSLSYALPARESFASLLKGWKFSSVANMQSALPWSVTDATDDISGTGGKTDRWNFYGNPSAFSGLGYYAVPFFSGTSNSDCVAKAASLDSGHSPLYPGYTYSSALAKYGCWAMNGSMLLPPAIGTYPGGTRGLFRDRGLKLLDVSLTKEAKISERLSGQLRFEVFNVLNKTQYTPSVNGNPASRSNPLLGSARATPDVQISNPSVGSGAARSIQLGFRLQF